MTSTLLCAALLTATSLSSWVLSSPLNNGPSNWNGNGHSSFPLRPKKDIRLVDECMLVGMEEATYFYKSPGIEDVCALYLISSPEQRIEITIESLSIDCDSGGMLSLLDGWEMSGEVFPPNEDSPLEKRVMNFCGRIRKRLFVTSTNAATVLYKIPKAGDKYRISAKFIQHPKPCNILVIGDGEIVTLRNHGLKRNCSLATVFPAVVKILQMDVGSKPRNARLPRIETGIMSNCNMRGSDDIVSVGGSTGLNTALLQSDNFLCGLDSNPRIPPLLIVCDVTSVKMISSGYSDNSITVAVSPITDLTDLDTIPATVCQQPL